MITIKLARDIFINVQFTKEVLRRLPRGTEYYYKAVDLLTGLVIEDADLMVVCSKLFMHYQNFYNSMKADDQN